MDLLPVPSERRQRPLLYGALVVGTLAVVAVTGWLLLSSPLLLKRQVEAETTQPTESMAPPVANAPGRPAKLALVPPWDSPTRPAQGQVRDAETGGPLRGVSVWAGDAEILTDGNGRFTTEPVKLGTAVVIKTPGYGLRRLTAGEG